MTPRHHPYPETLMAYAAGTLPNTISCVVACHLALCPQCAEEARWLAMVGGAMLRGLEAPPEGSALADALSARLPAQAPAASGTAQEARAWRADPVLPGPIASYLGLGVGEIPWKTVVKGVRQHWIKLPEGSGQMRLLRLTPGKVLLEHTHTGMELTMVLQGIYGDHTGDYRRGDVIEWTEGTMHQPRAGGDEECICLIANEHTPRFSRLIARLLRPILGF